MELLGEIQNIRKDRSAVQIMNDWINFKFRPLDNKFKKGDIVKIIYTMKDQFKNGKSIEYAKSENTPEIEQTQSTENKIVVTKEDNFKEYKDDKTASMLLSYSKDLCVAYINNVKSFEDLDVVMNKATECLLSSYKKIKNSL